MSCAAESSSVRFVVARLGVLGAIVCAAFGGACRAVELRLSAPSDHLVPAPTVHVEHEPGVVREPQQRRVPEPVTPTLSRFSLLEMPPDTMPLERTKRAHHALGYRWSAAESWIRERGFDVHTCYLPMVRLHTKLSADSASSTFWIYARCSFR